MYFPKSFFNIISLAALLVAGVSAQDDGPGFVTKCVTPGQVALTFDDGPSPFTPKLLGYLKAGGAPATFFTLAGSIAENGKFMKQAFDEGHQIALHSNTHADMNTLTAAKIKEEYTVNIKAVFDTIGKTPNYARPPFGNCNANCAKVLTGEMALTVVQWNCDSNDWQYEANVADQPKLFTNMANIINPSNPKTDSFITLQHDIKDYSVEYVPKIIEMIKGKGYKFVTVEECTGGKIQAYKEGGAAPAAAPAAADPAPAPAPAADPAPAPPAYVVAGGETPSASGSAPQPSMTNSAGKLSSAFSLSLFCLAFGFLY